MRQWLIGAIVIGVAAAGLEAAPKNVLLLISDNQNATDLGCYGHPQLKTPHLDSLAAEGTRFEYAFATTASCGPSRAVIYTGLHVHANGQYAHSHSFHNQVLLPHVTTIFDLLKAGGYRTALLGKDHLGARPGQYEIDLHDPSGKRDLARMSRQAEEFIRSGGDQPFFVVVSTHDPHPTSRDAWGVLPEERLPGTPRFDPSEVFVPPYLPDRADVRQGLAGYYEQISQMDAGFGAVLAMLERTGKEDETLAMFFSDHGSSEPGAMGTHYEPGVKVPFIVRHPRASRRGVASNAMVTLADVTPTILDWTSVNGPSYPLHGRSILGVLEQEDPQGWDDVVLSHVMHEITTYYPMRTIREHRYKLIWNMVWRSEYPLPIDTVNRSTWLMTLRRGDKYIGRRTVEKYLFRDPIELYDLQSDPHEVVNLADDPRHEALRRRLSEKLLVELKRTGDPWLTRHKMPLPGKMPQPGTTPPRE